MMNVNPMMIYFGQELGEPAADAEGYSGLDGTHVDFRLLERTFGSCMVCRRKMFRSRSYTVTERVTSPL